MVQGWIEFDWTNGADKSLLARGRVTCTELDELTWHLTLTDGKKETDYSLHHVTSIRAKLQRWVKRWPVSNDLVSVLRVRQDDKNSKPMRVMEPPFRPAESPWKWLEDEILAMAKSLRIAFSPLGRMLDRIGPEENAFLEKQARRVEKERQKREAIQARIRENQKRLQEQQHRRETERQARMAAQQKLAQTISAPAIVPAAPAKPVLTVPLRIESSTLEFQETLLPLTDLRYYFLRDRAALWWVSNQSDDLLALPYCRIERLEYQIRTALRIIGPLRGRALLSDEVGLGKTIEAGLVIKEYLTRGMAKRFLVLTVPSLVDQWEEELADKFQITTATTNHAAFRAEPEKFWRENYAIIASLHTLKQPAHLAVAQTVNWEMLVVDEAHYLRNRSSQSWQAVNALPRQFLLLLTATPVQNSLEDLYNLVTLLQPGQLPSPKEFRARFIDPKRPHVPREPEELRRLLGQVMIRNTRANAGINLPPRRAETVSFEPEENERAFWQQWEKEFRDKLWRPCPSPEKEVPG